MWRRASCPTNVSLLSSTQNQGLCVCMSQKREFCSCHPLADVLVIFYKGGHVRGGKGGHVGVVFCPSFDLFLSTLPPELRGYPVGAVVGVVFLGFFCLQVYARLLSVGLGLALLGLCECETD